VFLRDAGYSSIQIENDPYICTLGFPSPEIPPGLYPSLSCVQTYRAIPSKGANKWTEGAAIFNP